MEIFVLQGDKKNKTERLYLVDTYVWVLDQVSYLGVSSYYVTFIDDATKKTWAYHIQQKSNVFETLNKWKSLFENEMERRLKCLGSNKGGEYYRKESDSYISYHGIRREKMILGAP